MEVSELLGALAIGAAAGLAGGLIGVGGGVLFVPGLVLFLGLGQLDAQATSLLAVVLVGAVGAWRQAGYDNLRLRDATVIGLLSPLGVLAGVLASNVASERLLQLSFAAVQLAFAYRLARRAMNPVPKPDSPSGVANG